MSSRRLVEQLDEAACLELLSTGRIGRLTYNSRYGPVALVRGTAHHVDTEAGRASISTVGLESWVEAEPEHFIRVVPISIAGQRLRSA